MAELKPENLPKHSDKFCCPICLEEVRNPKYLPCYHTFCKPCIQTYISSTAACSGDNSPKTIQCPVCRKSIQAPSNGASSEEWACSLPEDKLILSMSVDSDRSENKYCMFCKRNDKIVPAKHWCKTCTETICDDCKSFHSFVPMLQGHKIVRLLDNLDLTNDIEVDEPCLVHKGKYLEVFCQDHDQLCCSICFATKHRTCKKVEAIEDVASDLDEFCNQITPTCFKDFLKKLDHIWKGYGKIAAFLQDKKQAIFSSTDTKVEEIKSLIDKAHSKWIKQFEQKHSDAIANIVIASDEVKRLAITVQDATTILQRVIENGSTKQIFITRHKVRHQILDHVNRLCNLNIWVLVHSYNQPDTDFLRQVSENQKFRDVKALEIPSTTIEIVSEFSAELQRNNILQRREIMAKKDWMKVRFEKLSEVQLPSRVGYGLFVGDTKVLLSIENPPSLEIYDVTNSIARCVRSYPCSSIPYGLCHSGESMNKVYVSFNTHVEHYLIDISKSMSFKKIEIIYLTSPMKAISRGAAVLFSRSDSTRMICSPDFSVKHNLESYADGCRPLISASFHCDKFALIEGKKVVVVDQNNEEIYKRNLPAVSPRGVAFDLQDNIFVCVKINKLRQISNRGVGNRYIDLPGIEQSYNVVLHPAGEKILVLDYSKKFCVYKVV